MTSAHASRSPCRRRQRQGVGGPSTERQIHLPAARGALSAASWASFRCSSRSTLVFGSWKPAADITFVGLDNIQPPPQSTTRFWDSFCEHARLRRAGGRVSSWCSGSLSPSPAIRHARQELRCASHSRCRCSCRRSPSPSPGRCSSISTAVRSTTFSEAVGLPPVALARWPEARRLSRWSSSMSGSGRRSSPSPTLAALESLPVEIYEAAVVDGAGLLGPCCATSRCRC